MVGDQWLYFTYRCALRLENLHSSDRTRWCQFELSSFVQRSRFCCLQGVYVTDHAEIIRNPNIVRSSIFNYQISHVTISATISNDVSAIGHCMTKVQLESQNFETRKTQQLATYSRRQHGSRKVKELRGAGQQPHERSIWAGQRIRYEEGQFPSRNSENRRNRRDSEIHSCERDFSDEF